MDPFADVKHQVGILTSVFNVLLDLHDSEVLVGSRRARTLETLRA